MMLFEVQTQRGAQNWITQSNWDNSADALREANSLVSTRRFRAVKVIKSKLDTNNLFRETTIFRHQLGERRRTRTHTQLSEQNANLLPELARHTIRVERRGGTLAWIICLGFAIQVALAIWFYSGKRPAPVKPAPDKAVMFELPSVPADRVRATLRIEAADPREIDRALPVIVDTMSQQPGTREAAALRRR